MTKTTTATTTPSTWQARILAWAVQPYPAGPIFKPTPEGLARFGPTGPALKPISLATARAMEAKGLVTVTTTIAWGRARRGQVDFVATLTPEGQALGEALLTAKEA